MAREITEEEILAHLKDDPKTAGKWINDTFPTLTECIAARKVLSDRQAKAKAAAPASGVEAVLSDLGLPAGVVAGAAGLAVARFAGLVKGTTTTYHAVLDVTVLRGRLRILVGKGFTVLPTSGELVILKGQTEFCRILLADKGEDTAVTISGVDLAKAKQGAGAISNDLMSLGRQALGGDNVIDGFFDALKEAADTTLEVGSDLWAIHTVAGIVEKYGAEMEHAADDVRESVRGKRSEINDLRAKLSNCAYCGSSLREDGICTGDGCGKQVNAAEIQEKISGLNREIVELLNPPQKS